MNKVMNLLPFTGYPLLFLRIFPEFIQHLRLNLFVPVSQNFHHLSKLEASYKGKTTGDGEIPIEDLEIFENVAYVMAYHADHTIPGNIDDWLDQFEMFSIYEVLPEILELWGTNLITDVNAKKNLNRVAGK